jgi:hypothetical protein
VNASALADGAARAVSMLEKAALLDVVLVPEADSLRAEITITNQTGHKLPTGYPEGRRMWVNLVAYDAGGAPLFESGTYDAATGVLTHDAQISLYEVELGLSPGLASAVGLAAGPSFHFVLNDTVYRDTRIPPRGFTNAGFDVFGGRPVDPDAPSPRYPDGQYWDVATYRLPAGAQSVIATLYYQTTSKEMIEFLRDENTTNTAGDDMHALWTGNGRAAPVAMIRDTAAVDVTNVPGSSGGTPSIALSPNPFQNALAIRLDLPRPMDVAYEVFDVEGRRVAMRDYGSLGGGATRLEWDGRNTNGADVGSGVFWVRVRAGDASHSHRVVRLR